MDYQTIKERCHHNTYLADTLSSRLNIPIPQNKTDMSQDFLKLDMRRCLLNAIGADQTEILLEMNKIAVNFDELVFVYLKKCRLSLQNPEFDNLLQKISEAATSFPQKLDTLLLIASEESETGKKIFQSLSQKMSFNDLVIFINAGYYDQDVFSFIINQMVKLLQEEIDKEKPVAAPSPNRILPDGEYYEEFIVSP
ncbi:MAG TPA: hypothetical protein VLH94_03335 [Spirochaetia bacterium]|nr:hypothetical protein [Spirochaetia bacterium]